MESENNQLNNPEGERTWNNEWHREECASNGAPENKAGAPRSEETADGSRRYQDAYNQGFNHGYNQGYNQGWQQRQQGPQGQQYGAPGQQPPYPGYRQGYYYASKDRVTFGILALLLGCFGVQYFYVNKVVAGVLTILISLITCGLWSFVTLIQGIIVLCSMSDYEFEQKFVNNDTTFPLF